MSNEKIKQNEWSKRPEQERPITLDRLVRDGEWTRLDESNEFRQMTVEGRIAKTGSAISNRISQLEGFFATTIAKQPDKSRIILSKIKYLRKAQERLGDVLADHINGERIVPQEINIVVLAQKRAQEPKKAA